MASTIGVSLDVGSLTDYKMFQRGLEVVWQTKLLVLLCLLISSCSSIPQKTITTYHGNLFPSLTTSVVGSTSKVLLSESESSDERRIHTGSDFFYSTLDDSAGSNVSKIWISWLHWFTKRFYHVLFNFAVKIAGWKVANDISRIFLHMTIEHVPSQIAWVAQ